jgi:hypothetical protein
LARSAVEPRRHITAYNALVEPVLDDLRTRDADPPREFADTVLRFLDDVHRPARLPIGTDPDRSWSCGGEFIRNSAT